MIFQFSMLQKVKSQAQPITQEQTADKVNMHQPAAGWFNETDQKSQENSWAEDGFRVKLPKNVIARCRCSVGSWDWKAGYLEGFTQR